MRRYAMPRPIAFVTRQAINWRIPIELLERIDKLRAEQPESKRQDRTAVVVAALQLYLATHEMRARRRSK